MPVKRHEVSTSSKPRPILPKNGKFRILKAKLVLPFNCMYQSCPWRFRTSTGYLDHIKTVHQRWQVKPLEETLSNLELDHNYCQTQASQTLPRPQHEEEHSYSKIGGIEPEVTSGSAKSDCHDIVPSTTRTRTRTQSFPDDQYPCSVCDKTFGTVGLLMMHKSLLHGTDENVSASANMESFDDFMEGSMAECDNDPDVDIKHELDVKDETVKLLLDPISS